MSRNQKHLPSLRWGTSLVLIGALALALRIPLAVGTLRPFGDPADYQHIAVSIAQGHGYPPSTLASPGTPSAVRPPFYPYLLGGLYALVGIHPDAGRLLAAVLGALTAVLVAWLGSQIWDRRVGSVAGLLAAICPSLIALNSTLLSESLFLPLEVGTALALLALRRGRHPVGLAVLVGALCALATLTRTAAILWLAPGALAIFLVPATWRRRLAALAAMTGTCLALFVPWTIRNLDAYHTFVPLTTQGGLTLVGQYNPVSAEDELWRTPTQIPPLARSLLPLYRRPGGINEAQLDRVLTRDGLRYIDAHPAHVPVAIALDTLRLFNLGEYHQFTTGLAYKEMSLTPGLWDLTTIAIQVVTVLAVLCLLARLGGRIGWLGSPVVWAVPILAIAATVPMVGTVRYRARWTRSWSCWPQPLSQSSWAGCDEGSGQLARSVGRLDLDEISVAHYLPTGSGS